MGQVETVKKLSNTFSIRLKDEDKQMIEEVRAKLAQAGRVASGSEILKLGLFLIADFGKDEIKALLNGGSVEIKVR